ncbi:MAG: hypothetical protein KDD44_11460 [Bdellovibrionales bacterium]|nr:hypothetical protein [Bdellovibrionales bacterium]
MASKLKQGLRQIEGIEGKGDADTVKLWESYKEQALLWRALFLLQMPVTGLSILAALVMYFSSETIIEVPPKPLPGHYSVDELPDAEFISAGTEVINLISSYTPYSARKQFVEARKYLWEPALTEFEEKMLGDELRAIEETSRSQLFFIEASHIKVQRDKNRGIIVVRLPGVRQKLIHGKPLDPDELAFYVTMTTIPRNAQNELGIVITDVKLRRIQMRTIDEDEEVIK